MDKVEWELSDRVNNKQHECMHKWMAGVAEQPAAYAMILRVK